ncbi:hypothetical protein IE81DRAFT_344048 [Ceraceosorus guamensis]|uniref:DUF1275 domain protein n=1 Tax=Ceraceosorus guamensis TaxID=1522189 RepID=A0A316WCW5_9BASI|nr:hypothetical protein IE81DRAFT_344048 [Ceraceosorus guamensis]PWN46441.1 hypothetical protein IE81DRAFT_344048 [Ceraceosorus guamensis]
MSTRTSNESTPLLPSVAASASARNHDDHASSSNSNSSRPVAAPPRSFSDQVETQSRAASIALALQCIVAGFVDAAAHGTTKTWVAFMTGNLTQLMISLVSLISISIRRPALDAYNTAATTSTTSTTNLPRDELLQRLSLSFSSILGFSLGAYLCQLGISRFGSSHRARLLFTPLCGSIVACVIAALAFFEHRQGWQLAGRWGPIMLGLLAVSMGAQAAQGQRSGNAPWATTVVFTATLTQIFADPTFPLLANAGRKRVTSVLCLLLGAALAQTLLEFVRAFGQHDDASSEHPLSLPIALLFLAVLQVWTALAWWLVPSAPDAR